MPDKIKQQTLPHRTTAIRFVISFLFTALCSFRIACVKTINAPGDPLPAKSEISLPISELSPMLVPNVVPAPMLLFFFSLRLLFWFVILIHLVFIPGLFAGSRSVRQSAFQFSNPHALPPSDNQAFDLMGRTALVTPSYRCTLKRNPLVPPSV